MIDRIAHYVGLKGKDEEKVLTFKFVDDNDDKRKVDVSCLNKKYFDKKEHKDDVVGYVHLKNKKKYSGKEYATLLGIEDYKVDIYSKKKVYEGIVGYITTTDGEYLAVVKNYLLIIILGKLCVLGLILGLFFGVFYKGNITPTGSVVVDNPDIEVETPDITAEVVLPDGKVTFDGTIETLEDERIKADNKDHEGEAYNGSGTIKVTVLDTEGNEHTLIDTTKIKISKGELPDVYIDFTKLDFELTPGVYNGVVYITYPDGSTIAKPIQIVIVSSNAGTIGINYSDKVNVSLADDTISLKYAPYNAPTKSRIEIILVDGSKEYVLGESDWIANAQELTSISLKTSMKSKLSTGSYKGIMRVYVDQGTEDESLTDIQTDIEVTISVQ